MASLTQGIDIVISAKDNASAVLAGIRDKADSSLGEKGGLAGFAGQAKGALLGLGAAFVGTQLVSGLANMVTKTKEVGERLFAMSERTGVSVEALSGLKFAAEQTGVGVDLLEQSLIRMNKRADDAIGGNKEAAAAFKSLGVEIKDADGKIRPMDALLKDVADGLKDLNDDSRRAALAQDIFGRSGFNLLPFLLQGSAGIQTLTDRAKELGIVMSGQAARDADDFGDALDELKEAFSGVSLAIGIELLPLATKVLKFVTDGIVAFRDFAPIVIAWGKAIGSVIIDQSSIVFEPFAQAFMLVWENIKALAVGGINAVVGTVVDGLNIMITGVNALGSTFGVSIAAIDWTPITVDAPKSFEERWELVKTNTENRLLSIETAAAELGSAIDNEAQGMVASIDDTNAGLGNFLDTVDETGAKLKKELRPEFEIVTKQFDQWGEEIEFVDQEMIQLGKTIDDFDINELAPPPNQLLVFAKNLGKSFTEPAGVGIISQSLVSAFRDVSQGSSFKEAFTQVGVAIGTAIGGPIGGIIAGTVASGLFGGAKVAGPRFEGATGEIVKAVELGGIGLLEETEDIRKLRKSFKKAGDRSGKSAALDQFAKKIREQLPTLSFPDALDLAEAIFTDTAHGEKGQRLNEVIRLALLENYKQDITEEQQEARRNTFRQNLRTAAEQSADGVIEAAEGFSGVVSKPTVFLAGERGAEAVNITPMAGANPGAFGGSGGNNHYFTFNISTLDIRSMEQWVRDQLMPMLSRFTRRESERGNPLIYTTGILTQPVV